MRNSFSKIGVVVAVGGCFSLLQAESMPLYNESSMPICENRWDLTFSAGYIYWSWQQSFTKIGTLVSLDKPGASGLLNGSQESVFQNPGYASGFQVGLGCNFHGMDDWRFEADYTWYKNISRVTTTTSTRERFAVSAGVLNTPSDLLEGLLFSGSMTTTAQLDYSSIDTVLQRLFYQGRRLTAKFSMGLKTLLVDESFTANGSDLSFIAPNINFIVPIQGSFQTSAALNSWALGPLFGCQMHWLLGYGLRLEGDYALSLLYTSFTQLGFTVSGQISESATATMTLDQSKDYNTVVPVAEASLGLGWGRYLCHQNLYLDLFAGYDFNIYWNRNMLDAIRSKSTSPGNMYLQGLTVRASIDF